MSEPIMIGTGYKTLTKVKDGAVGPQGPPGPDGKPAEFPNTLPPIPTIKGRISGISTLVISWTYEDKVYYKYELYGSRMPNFETTSENLIYEGRSGLHLFQVAPGEVWYFKVRGKNSYNKFTEFSKRLELRTKKMDDFSIVAENGAIKNALIDNLNADKIKAGTIDTNILKANVIDAVNASIGNAVINNGKIGDLDAGKITTGELSGKRITAGTIEATKLTSAAVNTIELGAAKFVASDIKAGNIKVGNANIVNGTISMAKIDKVEITDANIKQGTILNAFINNLDARKITTGSLDATKVGISSTSGNLTIKDNTIQIKDNQSPQKVRVQIGKDSKGEYGILVFNKSGEAIFDSDKGILTESGLSNGVVSNDKIAEDTIGPTKLNVDTLFVGDNAFITKLTSLDIDAARIKTGKISGERIDIDGLVTFKSFSPNIQKVFDVKGDKTYIDGGMIATNTINADKINVNGLTAINEKQEVTFAIKNSGDVEVNGLLKSGNFSLENNTGYRISPDGKAILNQAEIRGDVILPNAGITSGGIESTNPIRFWAGESYENRDKAPFKVYQNGNIYARDVNVSGDLFGSLNNGNLTIDNGKMIINKQVTYLSDNNKVLTREGAGAPELYLELGEERSYFNNNVVIGDRIIFSRGSDNINSTLSIKRTDVSLISDMASVSLSLAQGALGGLNIFTNNGGQHILRGSTEEDSSLVFDSEGTHCKDADFIFTRKDDAEDCKVRINGEVTVDTVKSNQQNISIRSIEGEGWGFFLS